MQARGSLNRNGFAGFKILVMIMKGVNRENVISIIVTVSIIALLALSGPIFAVVVNVSVDKSSGKYNAQDKNVTFTVSVDVENGERIPVQNLTLKINSSNGLVESCVFYSNGTQITGCDNISSIVPLNSSGYGNGPLWGYGYGYNGSWGTTNTSFGSGYGYGYVNSNPELRYNVTWNLTKANPQDGTYYARLEVYAENSGKWYIYSSSWTSFLIDTVLPEVSISNPGNNTFVKGTVSVDVLVKDENFLQEPPHFCVKVSTNNGQTWDNTHSCVSTGIANQYKCSYNWDTSKETDGADYVIQAKLTDTAGNTGYSSNVTVTVDRTAPVITNIQFVPAVIDPAAIAKTAVLGMAKVSDATSNVSWVNISFYNATAFNSSYSYYYNRSMSQSGETWKYLSSSGIFYTQNEGILYFNITAVDSIGNINNTYGGYLTLNSSTGANNMDTNTSVSSDANNQTTIDLQQTTNTTLQIQTNQSVSNESVGIALYEQDPTGKAADVGIPELGKYVEIEVSHDIAEALSWVMIRVYYTDEELSNAGIYEENLRLYQYNETSSEWEVLNSTVNAAGNYIEANATHLSFFGLFGKAAWCGDGYCNGAETCSTCPNDCGVCLSTYPSEGMAVTGAVTALPCEENWVCSGWTECSPDGIQTRTCTDQNECGTFESKPIETKSCEYTKPVKPECLENWVCSGWTECSPDGIQTRTCMDMNACGTEVNKPAGTRVCVYVPPAAPLVPLAAPFVVMSILVIFLMVIVYFYTRRFRRQEISKS